MKKVLPLFVFFSSLFLTSCANDDEIAFFYERVPIDGVEVPEQFFRNQEVALKISYKRPSDCYSFNNFNYESLANQRTVTVINVVVENDSVCKGLSEKKIVEVPLNFRVGNEESYVFRFWQGEDEDGDDQYKIIEIPVIKEE